MMVLASKKIHVSEYSPAQIKLTIAGSGKASKRDILDAVMYNLELEKPPKPDDSADALAIEIENYIQKLSLSQNFEKSLSVSLLR